MAGNLYENKARIGISSRFYFIYNLNKCILKKVSTANYEDLHRKYMVCGIQVRKGICKTNLN